MAIIGLGIDIIEPERIRAALKKHARFEARVFTDGEREYCNSMPRPHMHFAARFAAKEAAFKALGGRGGGLGWREVEVVRDESGRPHLELHSGAARAAERMGISAFHLSLAHTRHQAAAIVLAVSPADDDDMISLNVLEVEGVVSIEELPISIPEPGSRSPRSLGGLGEVNLN